MNIQEIKRRQEECNDLEEEIAAMEKECKRQNKQIKYVNDELLDNHPFDSKLWDILQEKEELLEYKIDYENIFFEDIREEIQGYREKLKEELQRIKEQGEEIKNEDNHNTDTNR